MPLTTSFTEMKSPYRSATGKIWVESCCIAVKQGRSRATRHPLQHSAGSQGYLGRRRHRTRGSGRGWLGCRTRIEHRIRGADAIALEAMRGTRSLAKQPLALSEVRTPRNVTPAESA